MNTTVYDLSDMSDAALRYLLAEPCARACRYVRGDTIDAYTCFAHRAQAELDRRVTGGILVFCGGTRTLARPVGLGFYKCARCGAIIRGIEDA